MANSYVECPGCGHALGRHVKNVIGEVVCLHRFDRVGWCCDCVDGQSRNTDQRRAREEAERLRDEEYSQRELERVMRAISEQEQKAVYAFGNI